jgi:cytochrome bd-type quinol oxidase subunit 2
MTKLSIPIKYGLLITLGVAAWVLIAHWLIPNPESLAHTRVGPIFFNVLQFAMIYLGLKAKEREYGDKQDFKKGLKTGVAISFVYGLTASLFFAVVVAFVGSGWLASDADTVNQPEWIRLAKPFAGLFLGALMVGLLYSAVLSFFLAKRKSEES